MDDVIVESIRRRLETKVSDLGSLPLSELKPADRVGVARDERRLGFTLPALLKRLYAEIGNGGFGPGYGLIGLTNGGPMTWVQLRRSSTSNLDRRGRTSRIGIGPMDCCPFAIGDVQFCRASIARM